jgi:hypothetical protein
MAPASRKRTDVPLEEHPMMGIKAFGVRVKNQFGAAWVRVVRIRSRTGILRGVCAGLALVVFLSSGQPALAGKPAGAQMEGDSTSKQERQVHFQRLLAKAREQGAVAVIVRFDARGALPESGFPQVLSAPLSALTPAQEAVRVQAIQDAQTSILENLRGKGRVRNVKRMRYEPLLALTVDAPALAALRDEARVVTIYEDEIADPLAR